MPLSANAVRRRRLLLPSIFGAPSRFAAAGTVQRPFLIAGDCMAAHTLPVEVWLDIFEHASPVPHELSDAHNPFLDPGAYTAMMAINPHSLRALFAPALATRAALVRVCKAWQACATPLLYRTLYINRTDDLPQLIETISARAYGAFVRRLDVLATQGMLDFSDLRLLLSALTGLEIVNLCPKQYITRTIPSDLLQTLAETAGSTLRALIWPSWPAFSSTSADYTFLLEHCTQLRVLCIGPWKLDSNDGACTFITPASAELRFIALAERVNTHAAPRKLYPALEHVFLVYNQVPTMSCQAGFLAAHADTLTAATVNVTGYHQNAEHVLAALEQCPRLRHLVFFIPAALAALPGTLKTLFGRVPGGVTHVGLNVLQIRSQERELPAIVRGLAAGGDAFPESVKVVRVMNELEGKVARDDLLECSGALLKTGVQLENLRGELIPDASVR